MQFILNIWWSIFPSTNIKVYYRMLRFCQHVPTGVAKTIFLKTARDKCSPREQAFIHYIGKE